MNLKNQPPVFVPLDHLSEFERLSKAALMDMVWDYALQIAGVDGGPSAIAAGMKEFRDRREIILVHRQNAKAKA